jgi:hypothetical protein
VWGGHSCLPLLNLILKLNDQTQNQRQRRADESVRPVRFAYFFSRK